MKLADESDFAEINQMIAELGYYIYISSKVYPVGHQIKGWYRRGGKVWVNQRATIIGPGTDEDLATLASITGRVHRCWGNLYRIIFD